MFKSSAQTSHGFKPSNQKNNQTKKTEITLCSWSRPPKEEFGSYLGAIRGSRTEYAGKLAVWCTNMSLNQPSVCGFQEFSGVYYICFVYSAEKKIKNRRFF